MKIIKSKVEEQRLLRSTELIHSKTVDQNYVSAWLSKYPAPDIYLKSTHWTTLGIFLQFVNQMIDLLRVLLEYMTTITQTETNPSYCTSISKRKQPPAHWKVVLFTVAIIFCLSTHTA